MKNKIKTGVVGVGHLGQHHTKHYTKIKSAELVGVYDINEARAKKIAKQFKTKAFSTLDEMLDLVDGVSIVTPTKEHAKIAEKCITQGKHVFIEKPITKTTKEADKIIALAKKTKVILQVGHIERFNPALTPLKDLIIKPKYIEVQRLAPYMIRGTDIPVVLENITMQDDYEGDFTSRRVLLYTLRFTAKTYLFGPASSATKDIIKKATISYLTGTDITNTTREKTYSVEPRAIKNYTGDAATTLAEDITKAKTAFNVADASGLTEKTYVDLNGEEIFITKITGNRLNVKRGQDGTTITDHLIGEEIFVINAADTALIEVGDDFGFSGGF